MRSYDNNLAKYAPEDVSRPDMDRRADWAEEDIDSPSYIANKPDSPGGGGGGAPFVVRFTDEGGSWVADKEWNDAKQAIESGTPVIGVVKKSGTPFTEYYTIPLMHTMNMISGNFIVISYGNNKMFYYRIDWVEEGYINYYTGSYTLA